MFHRANSRPAIWDDFQTYFPLRWVRFSIRLVVVTRVLFFLDNPFCVSTPIWLMIGCSSLSDSIRGPILNCGIPHSSRYDHQKYSVIDSSEVTILNHSPLLCFQSLQIINVRKKWAKPVFSGFSSLDPMIHHRSYYNGTEGSWCKITCSVV
jgi:hypothetical protein